MRFKARSAMVLAAVFAAVLQASDAPGFKCFDDFEDGCVTDGVPGSWGSSTWCLSGPRWVENGRLVFSDAKDSFDGTWLPVALYGDVSVRFRATCDHFGQVAAVINVHGANCVGLGYFAYANYGSGSIGIGGNNVNFQTGVMALPPQPGETVEFKFDYTGGELQLRVWLPDEGEEEPEEPLLRWFSSMFQSGVAGVYNIMRVDGGTMSYDFISIEATGEINEIFDDFDDDNPFDGDPAIWQVGEGTCGDGSYRCEDGRLIIGDVAGSLVGAWVPRDFPVVSSVRVQMQSDDTGVAGLIASDRACGGYQVWGSLSYANGIVNEGDVLNWVTSYKDERVLAPPPSPGETFGAQLDLTGTELWFRVWRPDEGEVLPDDPLLRAPETAFWGGLGGTYWWGPGEVEYDFIYLMDQPRAAMVIEPLAGAAPLEVTADGSLSRNGSASVRNVVRREWDFGDGAPVVEGVTATHTYAEAGRYTIRLTVTDDYGAMGTATRPIGVRCPASDDLSPWTVADIGEPLCPGSAWRDGDGIVLCAGGQASSVSDEFLYVHQATDGDDGAVVVRVEEPLTWQTGARIGPMMRDSLDPAADFAAIMFQKYTGDIRLLLRCRKAGVVSARGFGVRTLPAWLRITRNGEEIVAEESTNGADWAEVTREPISFSSAPLAGLAACGADPGDPDRSFTAMCARATDLAMSYLPGAVMFKRGDTNADNKTDIADAICALGYLFGGAEDPCKQTVPECFDAADANDDGKVDIADAVKILGYLFAQAGPLPAPFGECGVDETPAVGLDCISYDPCEEP